jgi:hypothetical protein
MSSFNFGGPVMAQTVPAGTAANRESRDVAQRLGDDHYTPNTGGHTTVRDGSAGTLSVTAPSSTGGRIDRDYLERGGDDQLTFNPASPQVPTKTLQASGRNDRQYVDPTTGTSALSSHKDELFDELKAGPVPRF